MSITAKQIAEKLDLSPMAVSTALRGKPGVSTETRKLIVRTAEEMGYDFSKLSMKQKITGEITCVIFHAHNAILNYTPIFSEITDGMENECRQNDMRLKTMQVYERSDDIEKVIEILRLSESVGIILLGTEINKKDLLPFTKLNIPVILLDTWFPDVPISSVLIDNLQGAYTATNYLIERTRRHPGHLQSSYYISNFAERKNGFDRALRENGLSRSKAIIHELSPSIDGAFSDMLEVIDKGDELANAYFADNDLIAIGAMKALKLRGYKIPDDIAIIGFDNISEGRVLEPSLTTMDIPRRYMGQTAVSQLLSQIGTPGINKSRVCIATNLIKRFSV